MGPFRGGINIQMFRRKKICLFLLLLFCDTLNSFGQDVLRQDTVYNPSIRVIADLQKELISQSDLDNGFYIHTVDSSYRLVSFGLTYPCETENGCGMQFIPITGQRIVVKKDFPKLCNSKLPDHIAIDRILVEKDRQFYFAKPFIIEIKK